MLSTVLDPRWKNFTFLQKGLYQNHVEALISLTKLTAFDAHLLAYIYLHDEYLAVSSTPTSSSQYDSESNMPRQSEFDLFDMMITNQPITTGTNSDPEYAMYENEREIGRHENPIEWWQANQRKYPKLSKIAYKYLCISATSTASERMFSASGHLTSDKRSRLTPDNANILLFPRL